ncbi:MAG: NfeD family protein [Candidatus Dependentiae bacterium]|nr:NfeD family protein [Candidatus Dependentiae bacterium]
MTHVWFLLTVSFIILELSNPGLFYFLSLAIGSACLFLLSFYDYANWFPLICLDIETQSIATQCIVFFATTLIALFLLHRYAKKSQKQKGSKAYLSNMYQLIGKTVEITSVDDFCELSGYGKVSNETWPIKLQVHQNLKSPQLKVGMLATITGVQGCHLQIVLIDHN